MPGSVEEGNINLLGDRIYEITASSPLPAFTPPFKISLPFDKTKSTGKPVRIVRFDPCRLTSLTTTADNASGMAVAPVTGFGRFAVVESKYSSPKNVDSGRCHFVSGVQTVTAEESEEGPGYAQAVNVFRSLGLKTIDTTCKLGPTNTSFNPPGEMKICYDPAAMNQPDITDQDLDIYQFNTAGVQERLAGMFHDRQRGFVTGSVSRFSSQFGAFAHVSPIPASDLLPPITTLSLDGRELPQSPSHVASTTSTFTLAAADPLFPGAPQSGVAATFLLLDSPFVDTATTPGQPYAGPFALSSGTHTLAYYSADVAGNIESVSTVTVLANPPPSRGVAGLGIGRDPANRLWTVALDGGAVKLARTDEAGAVAASAPLPEALSNGRWGILFDQAGDAYAVGAAEGPSTQASDLAVYKATPNGDAISSSRFFDGGSGSGDFIFDVAAPGWIGGAIESQGETLTAALWRFDPADGAVSLSTTFASGAAMGVAGDTDGSVWTAGFVRNPAPRSSRVYDLGLWHFAADGRTLVGGPFVVEAYAADLSLTDAAKILVSSNTVTVVAPRGRPGGGTDLGTTRFEKSSGAVLSESAWRAGDGSSAYPAALLTDGDGSLAAGGLDDGATRAALWRFGADGALVSASLADAGGARGAVTLGADHWLSVDDATAPYKLTGESSAAGALADVRAPRVVLVAGLPSFTDGGGTLFASATAQFSFSVADDKLVSGDGLGAGVTTVFYRADSTGAFTAFANPFSFAAEGAHAVEFYGVDAADNPGPILLRSVTVDQTAPATQAAQNGAEVTLTASDGSGSGVARIRYLVDYGNPDVCNNVAEATGAPRGTCENPWYAGPFTLSNGPHTIYFQAFDAVGNAEVLRATYPFVEAPGSGPSAGGMGIGKDPLDTFWTAVSENDAISFAHSDSSGVLISSAALPDAVSGFPWSVLFDQDGRAYAVGGAAGPATQALDLAVYKASPAGDAVESRTLFDSGYANNDIAFDAKAPGWIVGAAQTSGPTDLEAAGGGEFSMALWRFDATLGTVQLKATYARAGFDLGAGLAVDADGSLWIAGYSLSPEAPAVGGFDLALWHYAANGQTLLGGPFLRPGYLDNLDGGLTARVFVSSQAVYVAAPRANNSGGTDMAFLRYDKASGLPTSEIAWRPADGAPSYPIAVLPEASGLLVAGGIGGDLTETGLWRFGFDGALQGVTTTDAGGATGAVFRGTELWLSVDGSTVPYRVQSETAVAGALVDFAPPRTSLAAGTPSSVEAQTVYVTSATPLGFAVADDYLVAGDGLGVGATQTFYAEAGGAFARFTSSFTLVAEGTHTVSFFSIDREGRAEAVKTQSVGVDLTAPAVTLVSSGTIFSITAVDPLVNGAASGVRQIQYLVDSDVECNVAQSTSAPPGTCENLSYAGPFELAVGTHTVYYAAEDNLANGLEVVYSSYITVGQPVTGPVLTPSSGPIGVPFSITGTGFGVYSGANTRVKFGTAVAPVSVWNNTTISGTIPGLSTGSYAVAIERQNASSVTSVSAGNFAVTDLNSAALNVSSGPIGVPFTITGTGFGPYAGTLSRVLVDGATAPLSVWNNTTITGTIPGVTPGAKTIVIQRAAGSFLSTSDGFAFEVTVPSVTAVSPSSGPIGAAYTLTGFSFGPYAGTNTRVLIGGATTALSLWNDRTIKGTVPGSLAPGVQTVVVQRLTSGGGFVESGAASFQVAGLALASLTPSSGPIGVPFTISGTGFGVYDGANTRVRFGVSTAALSLWNDTTITGTIPALSPGEWPVVVERQQGSSVSTSSSATFTATALSVSVLSPSSGPIGVPFTITGSQFGVYGGGEHAREVQRRRGPGLRLERQHHHGHRPGPVDRRGRGRRRAPA
ncbi:MAG: IPT/TIG domain-containing protein, partial [Elusimicrobia bacterium]|nr:IPT/TIG domain-containing protein [Elusimicrobiota bacterium]